MPLISMLLLLTLLSFETATTSVLPLFSGVLVSSLTPAPSPLSAILTTPGRLAQLLVVLKGNVKFNTNFPHCISAYI